MLQFEIKGIDGRARRYTLKPLEHERALWVYHASLTTLASALGDAIGSLSNGDAAIGRALSSVKYDTVISLAKELLTGAVVQGPDNTPIYKDLCIVDFPNFSDMAAYYRENPTEMYVAVVKAVQVNFPAVFSSAREQIQDLLRRIKDLSRAASE